MQMLKIKPMTDKYIDRNRALNAIFSVIMAALLFLSVNAWGAVSNTATEDDSSHDVMKEFTQDDRSAKSEIVAIPDKRKHLIMFIMGIPLLLLIATTVSLGVAMVIYDKKVFVAHMIFAGLSLTLAVGHAVVGLVWFNPF
ncbi:MAG: hypothetical protein GXP19_03980 [Gammaproteobacteria bacterium]|nr:hypothetical protein [Gammaproteobacteria bacterium]